MSNAGLRFITGQDNESHLGGNIAEGDPRTYAPSVWRYLANRFALKSVLDIGSGMGFAANFFHDMGMRVIAVDGLPFNIMHALYPTLHLDITKQLIYCKTDLVHCQEVVEHIEEKYLSNLINSLKCGKFILMTHATPGQGGHHHVNEQPSEYWISHMRQYSCELLEEDTKRIRTLASIDGAIYLSQTALLFANRDRI
ncbi:TPA: methyltransferase domain-containing protein [Salmonella enterica]|nr:methyltransferase domain-containing protein [Salmonella enterica]